MADEEQLDLVVLVPGRDEQAALSGLFERRESLGIRPFTFAFQRHPDRDAGCLLRAHEFLRRETGRCRHALVLFDRVGCGREDRLREELEREVEGRLADAGWTDRAAAVVIHPELEVWVWSDSPHVAEQLGWQGRQPELRDWLVENGLLDERDQPKPADPKQAVARALRAAGKLRSSILYRQLALQVGLSRCTDPAFAKLCRVLRCWFAQD